MAGVSAGSPAAAGRRGHRDLGRESTTGANGRVRGLGFGAGKLLTLGDSELMLACVRAYNDFLVEYASADLRRFVPIMALPMWDMELCEQEVVRAASAGHKGVIMTGEPTFWGLPPIAD